MAESTTGTFEPCGKAGGFLRSAEADYAIRKEDVAVPPGVCQALGLRGGETVVALPSDGQRNRGGRIAQVADVESINERPVPEYLEAIPFEKLIPIDPQEAVRFEIPGGSLSMRVVDLLTPIGLGQRGLIVAPPRTGKTILLQQMAAGIAANHPDVYMMVLLIDERPEEVTDMRRTVHGEVVASCNDQDIASHLRLGRLVIEKAKRLLECGQIGRAHV